MRSRKRKKKRRGSASGQGYKYFAPGVGLVKDGSMVLESYVLGR